MYTPEREGREIEQKQVVVVVRAFDSRPVELTVLHVLREKVTYRKTLACTANRQIVSSHTFFRAGISFRSFVAVDTHVLLKVTNLNQSIFHRMSLIFVHPKHSRYSHKNRIEIVCEPFEWTARCCLWFEICRRFCQWHTMQVQIISASLAYASDWYCSCVSHACQCVKKTISKSIIKR